MADGHLADMVRNGLLHTFHLVTPKPRARRVDLSGRRMVVTGASPGSLGYETARTLAAWGAAVVVTALDDPAGLERTLRRRLRTDGSDSDRVTARRLDLGNRGSVADFANWYTDDHSELDVLVNNAGILLDPLGRWREPRLSPDGVEIHWRTNYLGTFQLTAALLPVLLESGRRSGDARVVNVSSHQHTRGRNARFLAPSGRYHSWDAYGQSKLALIHLASELERRHGGDGFLRAVALHPGSAYTKHDREGNRGNPRPWTPAGARRAARGARPPEPGAGGADGHPLRRRRGCPRRGLLRAVRPGAAVAGRPGRDRRRAALGAVAGMGHGALHSLAPCRR